jgi:hypothetical protein
MRGDQHYNKALKGSASAQRSWQFRLLWSMFCMALLSLWPQELWAHVKWFTAGSYADRPTAIQEILTPNFYIIAGVTLAFVALGVCVDSVIQRFDWYQRVDQTLANLKGRSVLIIRIAVAMTLILSWQDDAMLVPNVRIKSDWIGWFQFGLAFLLMFERTVAIAGAGLIFLYGLGHVQLSSFHMLDYLLYFGVGYYLLVNASKNDRLKKSGILALYLSVGFSLCWVAMEKLIYPEWAIQIVEEHRLTGGAMDSQFLVLGASFVEFGLGFAMIMSMLQRPLSVLITLVFVSTSMIFGKVEIIGHTLTHGALIVFLIEGQSPAYSRITRHFKSLPSRMVLAGVLYVVVFCAMLFSYSFLAEKKYKSRGVGYSGMVHEHKNLPIPEHMPKPSVDLVVKEDPISGYNLRFVLSNFEFAPQRVGQQASFGEGHAHLYLDGEKIARIYNEWYHLPPLPEGSHELKVSLHGNGHELFTYAGHAIEDKELLRVATD